MSGFKLLALALILSLVLSAQKSRGAGQKTIVISGRKQLFLDDYLIASSRNLQRLIHPARKYAFNPVLRPGFTYGSVLRDTGKYRIWYMPAQKHAYVAYAESQDGIAWTKPDLGLVGINGRPSNIVAGRRAKAGGSHLPLPPDAPAAIAWPYFYEFFGVHKDTGNPDPSRRYMMGFLDSDYEYHGPDGDVFHKGQRRGLGVAGSADGIHWRVLADFATEAICDGDTHWMFDPAGHKYVLYGRTFFVPPDTARAWGIRGPLLPAEMRRAWGLAGVLDLRFPPALQAWLQDHYAGRAVARVESPDFLTWNVTKPAQAPVVMTADVQDKPGDEAYDMDVFPYEGIYIGLLRVYHNVPDDPALEVQLTASRDSFHFTRVGDRTPFIASGAIGEWDRFNLAIPTGGPIPVGEELRFYFAGSVVRHAPYAGSDTGPIDARGSEPDADRAPDAVGFATIARDRFVSLAASFDGGEVLTKPVVLAGRTLHVNAKSDFGEILIQALDESGRIMAQSHAIRADSLDLAVEWERGAAPQNLPVALRFLIRNAHLFAVWSV